MRIALTEKQITRASIATMLTFFLSGLSVASSLRMVGIRARKLATDNPERKKVSIVAMDARVICFSVNAILKR